MKEGERERQTMKQTMVDALGRGLAIYCCSKERAANSEANKRLSLRVLLPYLSPLSVKNIINNSVIYLLPSVALP